MKSKASNKILALALAATLLLGGVLAAPPVTVYADGPIEMQEGLPSITANTDNATTIGFGGKEWYVIGNNGRGVASENGAMTLLLKTPYDEGSYGDTEFHGNSNHYNSSTLQNAMDEAYGSLSSGEKMPGVIIPRNLEGESELFSFKGTGVITSGLSAADVASGAAAGHYTGNYYYLSNDTIFDWYDYHDLRIAGNIGDAAYTGDYHPDHAAGSAVAQANFWPLSVAEASLVAPALRTYGADWWLRSPGNEPGRAAVVTPYGYVYASGLNVFRPYAIRPAFYLDLSSVIFTSAAAGGKSAATVESGLVDASAPDGVPIKLTVLDDDNLSLSVEQTEIERIAATTYTPGNEVSITYTGAVTTPGETTTGKFVSCVIGDDSGNVLYYGKLSTAASGEASFIVPNTLADGDYTIKLFNEECNGDNYTDFCSTPVEITLEVQDDTPGPGPGLPQGDKGDPYDGIDFAALVDSGIYYGTYKHATAWNNYLEGASEHETEDTSILWRVMGEENSEGKLTLMSEYVLDSHQFHNSTSDDNRFIHRRFNTPPPWGGSLYRSPVIPRCLRRGRLFMMARLSEDG